MTPEQEEALQALKEKHGRILYEELDEEDGGHVIAYRYPTREERREYLAARAHEETSGVAEEMILRKLVVYPPPQERAQIFDALSALSTSIFGNAKAAAGDSLTKAPIPASVEAEIDAFREKYPKLAVLNFGDAGVVACRPATPQEFSKWKASRRAEEGEGKADDELAERCTVYPDNPAALFDQFAWIPVHVANAVCAKSGASKREVKKF